MMPPRTRFDEPRWLQCILKLSRTVTIEQRRRLVCIPDLTSAQSEREKLQRQHGPAMSNPKIAKIGKGKDATWTLSYTLRESRTEELF